MYLITFSPSISNTPYVLLLLRIAHGHFNFYIGKYICMHDFLACCLVYTCLCTCRIGTKRKKWFINCDIIVQSSLQVLQYVIYVHALYLWQTPHRSWLFDYLINSAVLPEEQPFIGCDMRVYIVYLCTRLPNNMTNVSLFMYQCDILTVCFLLILFT